MSHTLSTVCADDLWVILWIKYYDWTNHYLPHTEVKQSSMGFSLLFLFLFYHSQSIIFSTTPFYTLTSNLGSNKSLIKKNVSAWTSLPLPRIPPLQVVTEHWVWAPWVMQQISHAIYSHMVIYMFQCYSFNLSLLLLPPLCPIDCSLCLPSPFSSVQFSSVAQSCPTLCDPINHSTPGLPVHDQLPEFTQTHVRWVGDAI